MVFSITNNWCRIWVKKGIAITFVMFFNLDQVLADTFSEIVSNTALVNVLDDNQIHETGVGIFLGVREDYALLLLPAHLLSSGHELGSIGSRFSIQIKLRNATLNFKYENCRHYLKDPILSDAQLNDYAIIEVPVKYDEKGLFFNLDKEHFSRPKKNKNVFIFSEKPGGGYDLNSGSLSAISTGKIKKFSIKTEYAIQKGESGSVIMGYEHKVYGILTSSDVDTGKGIFPEPGLYNALNAIKWAKSNRTDKRAMSFAIVPTYQYSKQVVDLGGGLTQTNTEGEVYTSFEFKYYSLAQPKGSTSARKLGIVAGYSAGSAHASGQVEDADYTVKFGMVIGEVDRFKENTGEIALFLLGHRADKGFEYRLGMSMEVMWGLMSSETDALDIGLRLELNDLGFSDADGTLGIGLVMEYSWMDLF